MIENLPQGFMFNSKIYRYGEKDRLWAIGYEWVYKGNVYKLVHYGDWREGDKNTWKSYDEKTQSTSFKKKEKEALEEIKISIDIEREEKHKTCADFWKSEWDKIPDPGYLHEYLTHKRILNSYGSKIDPRGTLLIRIINTDGIVGVQKIFKTEEGFIKRYSTGIKKKGSFSFIGDYESSEYIYIAEGFATAASIHEATNLPVVIALDSGNLFDAIITLRKINPSCKIIICADVDKNQIGIKKAQYCKSFFINCIVKIPKFSLKNDKQTDFNDLACSDGIGDQLLFSDSDFIKVTPLGYSDDRYYYTSSINSQIVSISSSGHVDKNLYRLAPHDYWKKGKEKIHWPIVASELMEQCHNVGIFNPDNVRGRGAWIDNGVPVINDGKSSPEKTKYHYQKLIQINYDGTPYSNDEMKELEKAFSLLMCKNSFDYIYLASWLIQAQIFACLPWRFHLWVTGEKGSGKSHIIKWLARSMPLSVLTNNATVAGIRQEIRNDATPICFDETEPDSGRMDAILELARQMSSNDSAKTLRGSSNGQSVSLNTQALFVFGSIQVQKLNSADASRIFIVEMNSTKDQNKKDFEKIIEEFSKSEMNKSRIFQRAFQCLPSILRSIEIVRANLLSKKLDARQADQLSSVLACYHVYNSTEAITNEECDMYLSDFDLLKSEYIKENEEDEAVKCINEIMEVIVDSQNNTIESVIISARSGIPDSIFSKILSTYGIRVLKNDEIFIASKNSNLSRKLPNYPNYASILRRNKTMCVSKKAVQRLVSGSNKTSTGIIINF